MSPEIVEILLNGMSFEKFIGFYLIGATGALMFFLSSVYNAIKKDITTPMNFSWKYFMRGMIRIILALISLSFAIVYFSDFSKHLFNLSDGQIVELNGFSALLMGVGIDDLWKKLLSAGASGAKAGEKMMNKMK
jgi:hypothetical protein